MMVPPPSTASAANRPSRRMWWAVMLFALALRLAHAPLTGLHHGDELWQYLEPAYDIAEGPWVKSWEWREGARSWLVPVLLALPMKLGLLIAPGMLAHVLLPRVVMALLSLMVVQAAFRLGARFSARHALIAGFVAAVWFELVYFGPRTLSEPIGVALLLGAAALLFDGRSFSSVRLGWAGFLLAAGVMVRFQFGPAALVLALPVLATRRLGAWPLVAGGAVALMLSGLADLAMGQVPLRWLWVNFEANIVADRASQYGVSGPLGYVHELAQVWSWSALVLVPLAMIGARRYPVLMAAALVHLALHSLIPHKEYRFILLTTTIFVMLAALASADLIERFKSGRALPAVALAWLALSAATGALLPFGRLLGANSSLPLAMVQAGQEPKSCGLALVGTREKLVAAYAYYGRQTPILQFHGDTAFADARANRAAFNLMLAPYGSPQLPGYRFQGCSRPVRAGERPPDYCLSVRPGNCAAPPPEFEVNAVLRRLNT